jgi:hypothetical protein
MKTLPSKNKARGILQRAVKSGKVKRCPCEVCGRKTKIEAHHTDYTKPFQVMWLCRKHHSIWHKENGYPEGINYKDISITRDVYWALLLRMAETRTLSTSAMINKLLKATKVKATSPAKLNNLKKYESILSREKK